MAEPNWSALYSNQGLRLQGNTALDDLRQKVALQQQQRIKDDALFAQEVAKMNFKGSRDADLPELQRQYGEVLKAHADLRNIRNPRDYAMANANLQSKMQQALYSAAESSEHQKYDMRLAAQQHNPNAYLREGFGNDYLNYSKLPSIGRGAQKYLQSRSDLENNMFEKPVDVGKVSDAAFKAVMSKKSNTGAMQKDPTTGLYHQPTYTVTSANKEDYKNRLIQDLSANPRIAHSIMRQYGANDIGEAVDHIVENSWPGYQSKLGTETKFGGETQSEAQRHQWTPLQIWNFRHYGNPNAPGVAQGNLPTPSQALALNIKDGVENSHEKLFSLVPKGTLQGTPTYTEDPNTGEQIFSFPKHKWTGGSKIPQKEATYRLNPNGDPGQYLGQFAQMAKEQNINLSQLNQIAGGKGGHGQLEAGRQQPKPQAKPAGQMIRVRLPNGSEGEIPADKLHEFQKNYPGAEKIQ